MECRRALRPQHKHSQPHQARSLGSACSAMAAKDRNLCFGRRPWSGAHGAGGFAHRRPELCGAAESGGPEALDEACFSPGVSTRFRMAVIELHLLPALASARYLQMKCLHVLRKLLLHFDVVHAHANSCCGTVDNTPSPRCGECACPFPLAPRASLERRGRLRGELGPNLRTFRVPVNQGWEGSNNRKPVSG